MTTTIRVLVRNQIKDARERDVACYRDQHRANRVLHWSSCVDHFITTTANDKARRERQRAVCLPCHACTPRGIICRPLCWVGPCMAYLTRSQSCGTKCPSGDRRHPLIGFSTWVERESSHRKEEETSMRSWLPLHCRRRDVLGACNTPPKGEPSRGDLTPGLIRLIRSVSDI